MFASARTVYQARNSTTPQNQCFRCDANLVVVSCGPVYRPRSGNFNTTPLGNTTRVHPRPTKLLVTGIITHRFRDADISKLEPFRPSQVSAWISVMFPGKVSCILRFATLPGDTTPTPNLVCWGSCPLVFTYTLLVSRFMQLHAGYPTTMMRFSIFHTVLRTLPREG
ncbi:hypothetical protein EDD15DRAFT_322570 [Pisolithus albus]|nr:hypothetical protein EDD15DRAFT_322570 [Pisolithus albus]